MMPELVSAIGGDSLGYDLDLSTIYDGIEVQSKEYEPETNPGLVMELKGTTGTVILFSSGKYNIAGASSIKELHQTHRELVELVGEISKLKINTDAECEVRNLVYRGDFGSNLKLEALVQLPELEDTEYQPEKFPGLNYRPPDINGLFKIFRTGKVTLTGVTDPEQAKEEFNNLFEQLQIAIDSG